MTLKYLVLISVLRVIFEYLLGVPSYLDEDMFAMQWFVRRKLALGHYLNVMQTCNKMHVGYKIWVEWELGNWIGNKKNYEMF
jgi:hypothetical protein